MRDRREGWKGVSDAGAGMGATGEVKYLQEKWPVWHEMGWEDMDGAVLLPTVYLGDSPVR